MLASTHCDNMIYAPILTSAATFALMSAASPAALACLTASPAASHCLTRASMLAGAAELSKLRPPASVLAMRDRYLEIAPARRQQLAS